MKSTNIEALIMAINTYGDARPLHTQLGVQSDQLSDSYLTAYREACAFLGECGYEALRDRMAIYRTNILETVDSYHVLTSILRWFIHQRRVIFIVHTGNPSLIYVPVAMMVRDDGTGEEAYLCQKTIWYFANQLTDSVE